MPALSTWDPIGQESDAIVVGTGPGGATLGQALAAAGRRVVFCELGGPEDDGPAAAPLRGQYPELAEGRGGAVPDATGLSDSAALRRAGRYADALIDAEHPRRHAFVPFIGSGPGGSSALYGMAMERLQPHDFEPVASGASRNTVEGGAGGSATPRWPISYADLAPYYVRAETLYRLRGERDPLLQLPANISPEHAPQLLPPQALTPAMAELQDFLRGCGLHPYRLPVASDALPECATCQGVLCHKPCKNDAARVSLWPAVEQHGAQLLTGCRVLGVHTEGGAARGVRVLWRGQERSLRAPLVVLAAGALQTPLILLRSAGAAGQALGNAHDQVGRHLMRHFIDVFQLKPLAGLNRDDPACFDNRRKEIAFNDLYTEQGLRLGTVQSFGRLPPPAMLLGSLQDDVRASPAGALAPLLPLAKPFITPVLRGIEGGHLSLASIVEDLPYAHNRVLPVPGDVRRAALHYTLAPEAQARIAHMRRAMAERLRGRGAKLLPQAHNNQRIAHVCGTCRMGEDPRTSVLDRNNRVHGLAGLYVTDASFFPTSGGTNPTLTIVANALRVADHLLAG